MYKSDLRKHYLEKRISLAAGEIASASGLIAERFFESFELGTFSTLHSFIRISKFNEIDTSLIYHKLWRDQPGIMIVAPRADLASGKIESVAFDAATVLSENAWRILEPVGGEVISPSQLDIVLVPLLCFDERGYRIGYGKGMYDRLLALCRPDCLKVGLDYCGPVGVITDVEATDIRLDVCVTPDAVYRFD